MNKDSSVGIVEDLVTNIMHLGASEYHLEILLRKYEDQLEFWYNGGNVPADSHEVLEVTVIEERIFTLQSSLKVTTDLRRDAMKELKAQATSKGNPDMWCLLKHLLIATVTSFEVWQVDLSNVKLKELFLRQSRVTNEVLAMFLGYEVTPCSACLTDQLKGE